MYIANLTIETSEGVFESGEVVRGLSSADVKRMEAEGYITAAKETGSEESIKEPEPKEDEATEDVKAVEDDTDGQQETKKKKRR